CQLVFETAGLGLTRRKYGSSIPRQATLERDGFARHRVGPQHSLDGVHADYAVIVERIGITSRSQVNQEVVVTSVRCRVRIWKQRRDRTLDKFVGLPSPPPGFLHLPDRVGVLH